MYIKYIKNKLLDTDNISDKADNWNNIDKFSFKINIIFNIITER